MFISRLRKCFDIVYLHAKVKKYQQNFPSRAIAFILTVINYYSTGNENFIKKS